MATQPTVNTYLQKGNREDLASEVAALYPDEVPFFAMAGKVKATARTHEWMTDVLASTSRTGSIEGASVTYAAPGMRTRVTNYTHIKHRNFDVTFTQIAVDKAGVRDEIANQVMKAMKSLLRDYDSIFLWSTVATAGATGLARRSAGLFKVIISNTALGTGTGSSGRIQITEANVNIVLQKIWNNGGNPRALFCGGFHKRVISQKFSAKTGFTWNIEASTRTAIQNVNKYEGSFGTVDVIPDRNMMASRVAIVTPEMAKIAILRDVQQYKGAATASSVKGWVEAEMCLQYGNEKAHGQLRWLRSTGTIS
ncbi:DUF5309 domain-containing protein [Candidatus Parcubacteria bacterium]|nr:DUF5309 domain-containing protein [Candidatus Parcubacteria bacterium]